MDKYEFNNAGASIYDFTWSSFCDNYIEMAKYSINDISTKSTLCFVLTGILKLLQPFMPYVTDELYSYLPIKDQEDIMISSYPKYDKSLVFNDEEIIIDDSIEFIKSFRNIKAENNMTRDIKVMFDNNDNIDLIIKVLRISNNLINEPLDIKSYRVLSNKIKATIFFERVETEEEIKAKEALIKTLKDSIERREKLLSNENYVNKAPQNIVELDKKKLEEEKAKLKAILEE
jgi:valyl-tRNA synthetase